MRKKFNKDVHSQGTSYSKENIISKVLIEINISHKKFTIIIYEAKKIVN